MRRNHAETLTKMMGSGTPITTTLDRNIKTLLEVRRQLDRSRSVQDRIADGIAAFAGSALFFLSHIVWFSLWILINLGFVGLPPFDPYPFGLLTMIVSLEAIFLSTFILISQNRLAAIADQRADLDLQVNILAEHELTKVLVIVDAIADHLKVPAGKNPELEELKKDISPYMLLREMEHVKEQMEKKS